MLYFIEVIALVVFVPMAIYFVVRKKDPKDARAEAERVLGEVVTSAEYCDTQGISEEELLKKVGSGQLKAYESMGMLFVQAVKPG